MTPVWTSESLLKHNLESRIAELNLDCDDAGYALDQALKGTVLITVDRPGHLSRLFCCLPCVPWQWVKQILFP